MKIEITMYGTTSTHLTDYDDVCLEKVLEHFEGLLKCAGYQFDGRLQIVNEHDLEKEHE